jgi:hypothetical protein
MSRHEARYDGACVLAYPQCQGALKIVDGVDVMADPGHPGPTYFAGRGRDMARAGTLPEPRPELRLAAGGEHGRAFPVSIRDE